MVSLSQKVHSPSLRDFNSRFFLSLQRSSFSFVNTKRIRIKKIVRKTDSFLLFFIFEEKFKVKRYLGLSVSLIRQTIR